MDITFRQFQPAEIAVPDISIDTITDKAGIEKANANKKQLTAIRTEYVRNFKPVKQAIDELKKQALDWEKKEVGKIEELEKMQDAKISEYNAEQYRIQQELKRKAEEEARKKADEYKNIQ